MSKEEIKLNLKKDSFSSLIHHHKLTTYIDQFFQHFQDIFDSTSFRYTMNENENDFIILVELPDISKENIEIEVLDLGLRISVEHSEQMMKENDVYHYHQYSQFSRRMEQIVPLPGRVDEKDIKATFKDGLLSIRIPKRSLSQTRKSFIDIE
jgi:HSP20 family protein